MPEQLTISIGQYSDKGRKEINQDFHGVYIPKEPQLGAKGIAIALADGISSSEVSQVAAEAAVKGFLADYFCTSETWTVKKSVQRVLIATNSWLYSQTRQSRYRYDQDKGYVCTFSAMVIKSATAYLFHIGDTRILRLRGVDLEQLTDDHRYWVTPDTSYLSRALGIKAYLDIDYQALPLETGDIFLLATDGVYEHIGAQDFIEAIQAHRDDLNAAARAMVDRAYANGSLDNLTLQIVVIESLPKPDAGEHSRQFTELPLPPILEARTAFDGYQIVRELNASSRSHVYLAVDGGVQVPVVIKTPSIDLRDDPIYLERFLTEEWIARRINSPYVLKPCPQTRKRHFLYFATEYIDGLTLAQWLIDNPRPDLETVRGIIEQTAKGLLAFHRLEMLHQDLRPNNIMIDKTGTVKIIDFGSVKIAGLSETSGFTSQPVLLGTAQYSAPEYFLGESGTARSDLFSLGVIAYQMLSGRLPYGAEVAKARTRSAQIKLKYRSVLDEERDIPAWVDDALRKAVHPDPFQRYAELSEFLYDLRHPNEVFLNKVRPALIERNPAQFWKGVSIILAIIVVVLLFLMTH